MSSNEVTFADEQQGKEALLDVRSDATPTDWCVDHVTMLMYLGVFLLTKIQNPPNLFWLEKEVEASTN